MSSNLAENFHLYQSNLDKHPSYLLRRIRPGDIVVFRQADYGTLIKRVERLSADGESRFVKGTHEWSTDSRRFGAICRADLIGKVVWSIHQKRLRS